MTFVLLAAIAGFASFALVDAVCSAVLALTFERIGARLDRYSPASRSSLLFRLRLAPAAIALIAGFGVSLPIFVAFEPFDTDEAVSRTLVVVALAGVCVLARAGWRALAASRATRRVSREWQRLGRRIDPASLGVKAAFPVFAIDASFPLVAVVGITRPVLFVAERVLAECSGAQVRAMIAHECAHVDARDNLKRFLLGACPDLLRIGGRATRTWTSAAEEAADAAAAGARPGCALDLAHALIRVARLAPLPAPALASSFYPGGDIERRVRRLVDPVAAPDVPATLTLTLASAVLALVAAALVLAPALHQVMEAVVRRVP